MELIEGRTLKDVIANGPQISIGLLSGSFKLRTRWMPRTLKALFTAISNPEMYSLLPESKQKFFLQRHQKDRGILVAAADDTSALGALRAVKELKRDKHVAIVGQDCIPDAIDAMKIAGTPFVASVSREVHTYGPRLMQLGLAYVEFCKRFTTHLCNAKPLYSALGDLWIRRLPIR
jgi:hypothetical protein